jgi:TonB-linked SusC/RagA family outer membrane protein
MQHAEQAPQASRIVRSHMRRLGNLYVSLIALPICSALLQGQAVSDSGPLQLADNRPTFFEVSYPSGRRVDARSSDILRAQISLDLHDESIAAALDAVANSAGVSINYSSDVFPKGNRVSLVAPEISLEGALSVILLDTQLDVQLTGTQLTLVPRGQKDQARAHQPGPRITGRVLDATSRAPIDAAAVQITGTTIGMSTTDSGTFAVRLPPDAKTFTVRRIGYLAQTVAINPGQTDYTIALARDVLRLEAQVVTGVATTVSSQSAANAVGVVTSQAINEVPAPTVENAIQGQIPGALVEQDNGGAPGGGMQIQIRGVTSINANASPLYVLDGVIVDNNSQDPGNNAITNSNPSVGVASDASDLGVNRIADINPEDIESVEVLKGASASAIYGSKASAGVVIITTKRGKAGKAAWNLSQKVGHFSDAQTLNIRQFPTLASAQAWYNNDIKGATTPAQIAADNAFIQGIYAGPQDYQTSLFGNSQASYETDLSVSGTQGGTEYYVSALSKYDNGTLLNTGYNKQSIRSNLTQQVSSSLSASANLFYAHSVTRRGISGNDNNGISPYTTFSYTPQFLNLNRQGPDGSWTANPFGSANAFADAYDINTPETTQRFIGGGNIAWTPYRTEHQSLQVQFIGGADIAHVRDDLFAPSSLQFEQSQALSGVSLTQETDNQYLNYSINLIHHYTGLSWLDATTSAGFVRERRDLTNPETVSQNLLAGINNPATGTVQTNFFNRSAQRDQSLYAQEQLLALDQRLSFTAGVTAERTTNDGDFRKFYVYPRFSASYRISKFADFLDELKIRGAIGSAGTQPLYGVKYTPFGTTVDAGLPGVASVSQIGLANVKPESETEIETGFDATMFNSRAQLTVTVYQKRITNLLLQAGVNASQGFSAQWLNGGEFTNQGAEISLAATPVQLRNGFTWVSTTSFYRNYSVVNSLPVPPFALFVNWIQVGRSVTDMVNTGVLDKSGSPLQQGDVLPGYTVSVDEAVSWGPLRLEGLLDWDRGSVVQNENALYYAFSSLSGDSVRAARFVSQWDANLAPWTENGTFVKLRTLSLSYTIPARWITGITGSRISSARLALMGRNLWHTYGKGYDGLDPEVSSLGNQNIQRGIEVTPYPPSRSYFLSLDLGF